MMLHFLWGCRGNLKLTILWSERVTGERLTSQWRKFVWYADQHYTNITHKRFSISVISFFSTFQSVKSNIYSTHPNVRGTHYRRGCFGHGTNKQTLFVRGNDDCLHPRQLDVATDGSRGTRWGRRAQRSSGGRLPVCKTAHRATFVGIHYILTYMMGTAEQQHRRRSCTRP